MRKSAVVAAVVVAVFATACSSGSDADAPSTTATTATSADSSAASSTAAPTTEASPVGEWETVAAPEDCMCGDGSPMSFYVRPGATDKVLFFMEGGGACFSAETCAPESNTFSRTAELPEDLLNGTGAGIWDDDNPENPFAGWSVVYVPYCTGDVHVGNATTDYGNGVVVEHKGYVNGTAALDMMAARFPDAATVVVAGESAGSIPTPLFAGLAADLYPTASITVIADGSGAYPDLPVVNSVIGQNWGTMNAVPAWPENAGQTVETWSLPGLFVQAAKHAPRIVFGRHDYAFDETQVFFAGLAGIPADDLVQLIDANEAQIEASGMTLWSYISPGGSHTILHTDAFYTQSVGGVRLVDWVRQLLDAGAPDSGDVHCDPCTIG